MFNKKLSLTANIIIFPFTMFYKSEKVDLEIYKDIMENLAKITSIEAYNKVLSRVVEETHIHKNASINFYISWQDLMNLTGKSSKNYKENIFENKIFHSEINLKPHVLAIAIVRLVIADFLERRDNEKWYEYVHACIGNEKIKS